MEQTTEQIIADLEKRVKAAEERLQSLESDASEEETWAESGYYLQQDMDAERSYISILNRKIDTLYTRLSENQK